MFVQLCRNEFMKIHAKRHALIFNSFIALLIIIIGLFIRIISKTGATNLDFLAILLQILPDIIMLFGIILAAQAVTDEFKDGTIKQLLIRPASRVSVIMSKFVTILLVLLFSHVVMLVVGYVTGTILLPIGHTSTFGGIISFWVSKFHFDLFLVAVTFAVAVFTTSLGPTIAIGVIVQMFSSLFANLAANKAWSKYVVLKYPSLASYYHGAKDSLGATLGFALMITLLTSLVIIGIFTYVFKHREIAGKS